MSRRKFIEVSGGVTAGLALGLSSNAGAAARRKPVRIGVVGVGGRGTHLLRTLLLMEGVEIPALCDIQPDHLERAQKILVEAGRPRAEGYGEDELHYEKMMERDDLDAVVIASYWQWHTPMAVSAMKNGKYAGTEVPASLTVEECWQLVDTSEETGVPCMMLENWSFRRDNLALLNMVRQGMLGEIVHCHAAHSHDCIDHWFFDAQGNRRWGAEFLLKRNCSQYTTHAMGPVISWLDINCGDQFDYLTATASASKGINAYFERKFGKDHPNAKEKWKQGDIVTCTIRTKQGKTIVCDYDMQLPRPYDNRWTLQGTLGVYNEQREMIHLAEHSPGNHAWEPYAPYMEKYEHPWWKPLVEDAAKYGHGGTDYLELSLFVEAVRNGTQTPLDVYDSASMSCLVGLSETSIAQGSAPIECPDFTRGKWKTAEPRFAVIG